MNNQSAIGTVSGKSVQRSFELTKAHEIAGLYSAFFSRAPDASGLEYWEDHFAQHGASLSDISSGFVEHPVFNDTYGGMNKAQFVAAIYKNVLGAEGDEGGIKYWIEQLNKGMNRGEMVSSFVQGALKVDLDAMLENGSLTQEEYDVAVTRQDYITNRSIVAVEFARGLGNASDVASGGSEVVNDPAYRASIAILDGVGADLGSREEALEIIQDALTSKGETPIGHIIGRRKGNDDNPADGDDEHPSDGKGNNPLDGDDGHPSDGKEIFSNYWTVDISGLDQSITLEEADAVFDSLIPSYIDFTITSTEDALGVLASAISVETDIEQLTDSYSDETVSAYLTYSLGFDIDGDDNSDVFAQLLMGVEYSEWNDQNNLVVIDDAGAFVEFTYLDKTDHEHFVSGFSKGFDVNQAPYLNGPEAIVEVEVESDEVSFEFELGDTFELGVNAYVNGLSEAGYYETDGSVSAEDQFSQLQKTIESLTPMMLSSFDMFYKVTEANPLTDEPEIVHDGYVQYQIDSGDILFV